MNLQNDHTLVLHEMLIGGDPQQGRRSNSKIVCKSFPVIETVKSMQYIIRNMWHGRFYVFRQNDQCCNRVKFVHILCK